MFNVLNHPIERITFDRWRGVNVMADASELAVAVSGRCGLILIGRAYKNFEKVWRSDVVMLSVAKELTEILFEKPIEIAPVQEFGQPDIDLMSRAEFVGPYGAGLSDSVAPDETSQRHCR